MNTNSRPLLSAGSNACRWLAVGALFAASNALADVEVDEAPSEPESTEECSRWVRAARKASSERTEAEAQACKSIGDGLLNRGFQARWSSAYEDSIKRGRIISAQLDACFAAAREGRAQV